MTDPISYFDKAMAALDQVKDDSALTRWDDQWTNSEEYLLLPEKQVRQLEDARDAKLRWCWGVGAGE